MRIATGTKTDDGTRRFVTCIPFLPSVVIALRQPENRGERSPDWVAWIDDVRCGALWKRTPKGGGEAYLSGTLESPVFAGGKIEVAVFAGREGGPALEMVWSPPRAERTTSATHGARDDDENGPF